MGHNISTEKRGFELPRLPLAERNGWHMLLACPACRDERTIDISMLLKLAGEKAKPAFVITRLRYRFSTCRQAPGLIRVRNRCPVHPGPPLIDIVLRG